MKLKENEVVIFCYTMVKFWLAADDKAKEVGWEDEYEEEVIQIDTFKGVLQGVIKFQGKEESVEITVTPHIDYMRVGEN